jgi:hypothetical protein
VFSQLHLGYRLLLFLTIASGKQLSGAGPVSKQVGKQASKPDNPFKEKERVQFPLPKRRKRRRGEQGPI